MNDSWVFSGEGNDEVKDNDFDGSGKDLGIGFEDTLRSKSPGEDEECWFCFRRGSDDKSQMIGFGLFRRNEGLYRVFRRCSGVSR